MDQQRQRQFASQGQRVFEVDLERGTSLAITQTFDAEQPNHFSARYASKEPVRVGDYIGDMRQGGGCNFDTVTIVPHCNGTHTETVGHITIEPRAIGSLVLGSQGWGAVISVEPQNGLTSGESYSPELESADQVLTASTLASATTRAIDGLRIPLSAITFLIVRTLPNVTDKLKRRYELSDPVPFLTREAVEWLNTTAVEHLLLDLPSVDRQNDAGVMGSHCAFWGVDPKTRKIVNEKRSQRTITEMIFVPDLVTDGVYWVDLQVPAWQIDAAPSRPIVYPVRECPGLILKDSDS